MTESCWHCSHKPHLGNVCGATHKFTFGPCACKGRFKSESELESLLNAENIRNWQQKQAVR